MSERFDANEPNFSDWASFFHDNGYIIVDNALSPFELTKLQRDLFAANQQTQGKKKKNHVVHKRFFEHSNATVDLVNESILFDFAQYLIKDVPGDRGNTLNAHLIHNNAFSIPPGGRGQAPVFHVDDCLSQIVSKNGSKLPDNFLLPVTVATWMIWLSDCLTPNHGPTFVVPNSHRWGRVVDADQASELAIPTCGKAGTAVLVNNQTWHRGAKNNSTVARDTLQLTFARRMMGHKFGSITNYHLPRHVIERTPKEKLTRWGFNEGGAYS